MSVLTEKLKRGAGSLKKMELNELKNTINEIKNSI